MYPIRSYIYIGNSVEISCSPRVIACCNQMLSRPFRHCLFVFSHISCSITAHMVTMQIMRALAERRSIVVVSDLLYKLAFYIKLGVHQLSKFTHDLCTYLIICIYYIHLSRSRAATQYSRT